jgi:hypothetical protein
MKHVGDTLAGDSATSIPIALGWSRYRLPCHPILWLVISAMGGDRPSFVSTRGRATKHRRVATTLATQSLASDRPGQHLPDDAPDMSSEATPGHDWLDGFRPTRYRKVEGSISRRATELRSDGGADRLPAFGSLVHAPGSLLAM